MEVMPTMKESVATICTRVVDFRDLSEEIVPANLRALAKPGALVMTEQGESYPIPDAEIKNWIDAKHARAGGQMNTAGPIARCGLNVTAIGNVGYGKQG